VPAAQAAAPRLSPAAFYAALVVGAAALAGLGWLLLA
jgi:hypothetical protein